MVGSLRNRVSIVNYSITPDGAGGTTAETRTDRVVWAKVNPLSGSRGIEGSALELEQVYEIWIRYEDYLMLSKKNWIQFENRMLTIHAFQIVKERNRFFKIIAKEDSGRDIILYDENFEPITDENDNIITT